MGFDVSYHPFSTHLLDGYFLPHVLGKCAFPPALRAEAKRRALIRFRANAWGLGCTSLMRERDDLVTATGFDSQVHVWGRPFFIAETRAHEISRCIDAYIACKTDAQVDAIARAQLDILQPGLSGLVTPALDAEPPTDAQIESMVFQKADILRDAVAALRQGIPIVLPNGRERDPADVIAGHLPYVAAQFCAHFQPGWMDRGQVAPSMILSQLGYGKAVAHFFESPAILFAEVTGTLPGVALDLPNTIESNDSLGGCVRHENIGELVDFLFEREQVRGDIEAQLRDAHGFDDPVLTLRKWREALLDAHAREEPFLEATEIYSGFEGRMN